jgi:hypothetical protein
VEGGNDRAVRFQKGRGLHQSAPAALGRRWLRKFFRDQLQLDDEVNSQIADRYTVGS